MNIDTFERVFYILVIQTMGQLFSPSFKLLKHVNAYFFNNTASFSFAESLIQLDHTSVLLVKN